MSSCTWRWSWMFTRVRWWDGRWAVVCRHRYAQQLWSGLSPPGIPFQSDVWQVKVKNDLRVCSPLQNVGSNCAAPNPIVLMSLQPVNPWRVALQQSQPPLRRLNSSCQKQRRSSRISQRTANCPCKICLTPGVQCKDCLPYHAVIYLPLYWTLMVWVVLRPALFVAITVMT